MYALKGKREYQEDCGAVVELGDILVLAIADGFNKPTEGGGAVSRVVIAEALAAIGARIDDLATRPDTFVREVFARIDERTRHFIAGSTLSLVIIDRNAHRATIGVVGDSIVALTDDADVLHIHPLDLLSSRHQGLATAFGDAENAAGHSREPHVAEHRLGPNSVLIVSSDGLYPVVPENNIPKIEALARHYIATIRLGGSPQDLANHAATNEESADNITVAVYTSESFTMEKVQPEQN